MLVLHGGLAALETMHYQISDLAADHLVIAPDSRGHGRSTDAPGPLHYDQMADDTVVLMDRLHIARADVVGWSDGGIIGLDLALRYPRRVGRLVAIGANFDVAGLVDPNPPKPSEPIIASLGGFYRRISPTPGHWPAFYDKVTAMWAREPHFALADLTAISAPVLVIAGEHDAIRRDHTDALARAIPGARELIIAGADHARAADRAPAGGSGDPRLPQTESGRPLRSTAAAQLGPGLKPAREIAMPQDAVTIREVDTLDASLNYLLDTGVKPVSETGTDGQLRRASGLVDPHVVAIADGRPRRAEFGLDSSGFELIDHATVMTDFRDPEAIRALYYPEAARLIAERSGAGRVHVFDHTLRTSDEDDRAARKIREPVKAVHNDYTEWSGPQRVRDLMGEEAAALTGRRFAIIQVWRATGRTIERHPLAILDARSLAAGDFVAGERRFPDRVGEIYQFRFNPAHRWLWFPRMRRDEALVFKVYDSATDGRARWGRTPPSNTRRRRPTPRRAKASRSAPSPSSSAGRLRDTAAAYRCGGRRRRRRRGRVRRAGSVPRAGP